MWIALCYHTISREVVNGARQVQLHCFCASFFELRDAKNTLINGGHRTTKDLFPIIIHLLATERQFPKMVVHHVGIFKISTTEHRTIL